jgi:glycosyltransferase involved in cell wall biosynthesis
MSICLAIAVYNNPETIRDVVSRCLFATDLPVFVLDDGSDIPLKEILPSSERIILHRHSKNLGKGEALKTLFRLARERGFQYALTLDGDGQHYPEDLPLLLKAARMSQEEILLGEREMRPDNSPFISRLGRAISDFWIWCFTGVKVRDSQCGVRLYPLSSIENLELVGSRYDFEMEILVQLLWTGVKCRSVPIRVLYPACRVSHFHKIFDNFRIAAANLRLFGLRILQLLPIQLERQRK